MPLLTLIACSSGSSRHNRMNTTLVSYPSCLNYLMEDRIAAHKLSGMRTAKMLSGLCWTLSRPEILSGPLITRQFMIVDHSHHRSSQKASQVMSGRLLQSPARAACHKAATDSVMIMQWNVLSQGESSFMILMTAINLILTVIILPQITN